MKIIKWNQTKKENATKYWKEKFALHNFAVW